MVLARRFYRVHTTYVVVEKRKQNCLKYPKHVANLRVTHNMWANIGFPPSRPRIFDPINIWDASHVKGSYLYEKSDIPADTQRWNNINSTLMQHLDVESTLNRRCFKVVYLITYCLTLSTLGKLFQQTVFWNTFLIFPRKQYLAFHASCLQWRQFALNVKSSFLGKIRIQENRIWPFLQIVSNGDNLHEMSNPVFWEK